MKVADNYYLINNPKGRITSTVKVIFESNQVSSDLLSKQTFSDYVSFNVPVDQLLYTYVPREEFGSIKEVFPREYAVEGTQLRWERTQVSKEELFLVKYDENTFNTGLSLVSDSKSTWPLLVGLILGIMIALTGLFLLFYFILWKKIHDFFQKKELEKSGEHKKESRESKPKKKDSSSSVIDSTLVLQHSQDQPPVEVKIVSAPVVDTKPEPVETVKEPKEVHDEIVEKYLTDNEKEVVEIVRKKEGISQYDILNELPSISKSNLSKIISKLHSRKFLQRIRVGKVNKIHLGEKFSLIKDEKPDN
jgi:uncharacterized membrane protein